MAQQYALPNWTYTNSVEEYHAAWGELVAVVREFFPQYEQISFGPQFALKHEYLADLILGVTEVQAMKEYRDRKQAEVAALQEEVRLLRAAEEPRSFDRPTKLPRLIVVAVLEWLLTQDPTSMEGLRASMNWDEGFDYEWDDEVEALSLKVSKHFDATWKRWAEEAEEDS